MKPEYELYKEKMVTTLVRGCVYKDCLLPAQSWSCKICKAQFCDKHHAELKFVVVNLGNSLQRNQGLPYIPLCSACVQLPACSKFVTMCRDATEMAANLEKLIVECNQQLDILR